MLQRARIALCAALMSSLSARGPMSAGPAPDSHATATIPAAAPPHGPQGVLLPLCRELKKWRIRGPMDSTIATIRQLKRVANMRVMVGDHQEDDGQREVVVMDGALLGLFAPGRIGRFAGE